MAIGNHEDTTPPSLQSRSSTPTEFVSRGGRRRPPLELSRSARHNLVAGDAEAGQGVAVGRCSVAKDEQCKGALDDLVVLPVDCGSREAGRKRGLI